MSSESLRPVVQGEVRNQGSKQSGQQKSVPAKKENGSANVAIQSGAMEKVVVTTSYRSRLNPEAVEFKEAVLMTDKDKSELQAAKDSASYYLQLEGDQDEAIKACITVQRQCLAIQVARRP